MKAFFAIPGEISTPTGGYAYDRRMLSLLPGHGIAIEHFGLPGSFPNPPPDDVSSTRDSLASLPHDAVLIADGLAFGAFPEDLVRAIPCPIVALVHHPLAFEAGTPPARAAELEALERAALAHVRHVVATSAATARLLVERFDVPRHRLTVAMPGVESASRALGSNDGVLRLLSVGAISRRKGYHILVEALAGLAELPWHLTIVGALDRNIDMATELRGHIAGAHLSERITLAGAVDEAKLALAYAKADLFVMPSLFEGYGMVITEALARGLPIVSTSGGALAEVVPREAALVVEPGDAVGLRDALRRMLVTPALRAQKSAAAWALAGELPRWDETAATIANVLKEARG